MIKESNRNKDVLGYYRIIGVTPDADDSLIKNRYHERAKIWHPDHNSDDTAKENFQKLSVAYKIISDENKRLMYDLLCSAYGSNNFPDMNSLKIFRNLVGKDDFNLKVVSLTQVTGKFIKCNVNKKDQICNYSEALHEVFKTSVKNWLLGWWGIKAFALNAKAIFDNYKNIGFNKAENYQLWAHNAVAYWQNKQLGNAYISAVLAGQYADDYQKSLLKKLIIKLKVKPQFKLKNWNMLKLRLVQLIMPLAVLIAVLSSLSVKAISEKDLMAYFSKKKEITYNQEVRFYGGRTTTDDMVVAKIIKFPVDVTDMSRLYHVSSDQDVMYGPSEDFDVIKKIKQGTTVRITGISPDEIWYRVMLDEGEMGFIKKKFLRQGIGNPIPFGSQIYKN